MGSEFLTESAPPSYTERFNNEFPFYLSIGMTEDQFWNGDCELTRHYRKAFKMKQERENYYAWLQGAYIYDALCAVSPVLHAFAKSGTKPMPYHKQPYRTNSEQDNEKQQQSQMNTAKAKFEAFTLQFNKQFDKNGGEISADN